MDNDNDIWSGSSIKTVTDGKKYSRWEIDYMIDSGYSSSNDSIIKYVLSFVLLVLTIVLVVGISVFGPSMWHNALIVCYGKNCTTYTEWKVINEDHNTGVLEVWAGGRLQRLSNGTWHYE